MSSRDCEIKVSHPCCVLFCKISDKQFVVVQITSGDRCLKKWFGAGLPGDTVLMDVFAEFASG